MGEFIAVYQTCQKPAPLDVQISVLVIGSRPLLSTHCLGLVLSAPDQANMASCRGDVLSVLSGLDSSGRQKKAGVQTPPVMAKRGLISALVSSGLSVASSAMSIITPLAPTSASSPEISSNQETGLQPEDDETGDERPENLSALKLPPLISLIDPGRVGDTVLLCPFAVQWNLVADKLGRVRSAIISTREIEFVR